jgi:hypothetical protein
MQLIDFFKRSTKINELNQFCDIYKKQDEQILKSSINCFKRDKSRGNFYWEIPKFNYQIINHPEHK